MLDALDEQVRSHWVAWKYYFRIRLLPLPRLFKVSLSQEELKRGQELADCVVTAAKKTLVIPKP